MAQTTRGTWASVRRTCFGLAAGVGIALLVTTACVSVTAPARNAGAYRSHARNVIEATTSSLKTASLTVDAAGRDRTFPPFVAVSLSEAETAVSGAQGSFESIQPPGASSDRLRAKLTPLLDDATAALADARIAARRNDADALAATAEPLEQATRRLEAFEEALG
jgi:hypothetical protein